MRKVTLFIKKSTILNQDVISPERNWNFSKLLCSLHVTINLTRHEQSIAPLSLQSEFYRVMWSAWTKLMLFAQKKVII